MCGFFFSSRRRHTRCALVTGVQTCALPIYARVNCQSQSGGGFGRDIIIMFGSDDPAKLEQTANKLVAEMAGIHEIRAPRVAGDMNRPEIVIKPRFDLAASLGEIGRASCRERVCQKVSI